MPTATAVESWLATRRAELALKRAIDIVVAVVLLFVLSPLLAVTALAIRLTSRGPAMFSQLRWGSRGQLFRCYKFRTMVVNPDVVFSANPAAAHPSDGSLLKMERDPRVTRIGAILRRSSIDELPQLLNVLRGEMSLVGPRPLMRHMLEPYPQLRDVRCSVRPGITGLWQIRDRAHSTSVLPMVAHDLEYILGFSLRLDLRILFATVGAVASARGAF